MICKKRQTKRGPSYVMCTHTHTHRYTHAERERENERCTRYCCSLISHGGWKREVGRGGTTSGHVSHRYILVCPTSVLPFVVLPRRSLTFCIFSALSRCLSLSLSLLLSLSHLRCLSFYHKQLQMYVGILQFRNN